MGPGKEGHGAELWRGRKRSPLNSPDFSHWPHHFRGRPMEWLASRSRRPPVPWPTALPVPYLAQSAARPEEGSGRSSSRLPRLSVPSSRALLVPLLAPPPSPDGASLSADGPGTGIK